MSPQQKRFTLVGGQVLQRAFETLAVATQAQQLLGIGGTVDHRVSLFVIAVVQGVMDAVFAPVIDQSIAGNLVKPGTKIRPSLWLAGAADQAQPGVLINLFGQLGLAAQAEQEAVEPLAVTGVQNLERRPVTRTIARQQRFIA
ncbi:hypothetical protein D3C84_591550 [compost metagenome]